jgi:hypothetical protein
MQKRQKESDQKYKQMEENFNKKKRELNDAENKIKILKKKVDDSEKESIKCESAIKEA